VKQTDQFRCGPVAILNAIKWSGGQATKKKDLPRITSECCCTYPRGTPPTNLMAAIKKYRHHFKATIQYDPPKRKFDRHLENGNAAILDYFSRWDGEYCGHYILVLGKDKRCYTICNDRKRLKKDGDVPDLCSCQRVSHKKFSKVCWKYYKDQYKVVFFLTKNERN
jgi:hypothetical protein